MTGTAKHTSGSYNGLPGAATRYKDCAQDVGGPGRAKCWHDNGACTGFMFDNPSDLKDRFSTIHLISLVAACVGLVLTCCFCTNGCGLIQVATDPLEESLI